MGFVRYAVGALVGIGLTLAYHEYELASIEWQLHAQAFFDEYHVAIAAVAGLLVVAWVLRMVSTGRVVVVKGDSLKPRFPSNYPIRVQSTSLQAPPPSSQSSPTVAPKTPCIACYEPATLRYLGHIHVTTPAQVETIVSKARAVQAEWARTSFSTRRRVLSSLLSSILSNADAIVRLSCLDTGKPATDALFGEILSSAGKLQWIISEGERVLAREGRVTNFTSAHKRAYVEYVPLGVIGVIAPWNYPFYNTLNHIASGLMAGNAVVIKISEYSAWSAAHFVPFIQDVLEQAGFPRELVQLVNGFGETGAALIAAVDKVIFTGSPGIGKLVMAGAAKTLTPLVLELGGKDPFIVCEDANVDAAVTLALRGTYQNSGQNCVGIERIYVYESVFDQFVDKAAAAVRNLRVGSPVDGVTGNAAQVDMGPITTAPQLELIQALVDDAVSKGAQLLVGGFSYFQSPEAASKAPKATRGKSPARGKGAGALPESDSSEFKTPSNPLAQGLFYAPTVLAGVTHDMRIANEEVFGPVMSIFKVPANNDEAVIAMANATQYGLGATVYSGSPARANRIAARLHCGMVGVNAYGLNYLVQSLPFGGVGASGFDRFGGPEGLRACCLMRSVVTDWLSWLSIPTPVPKQLQYPVAADAPAFTHALIQMQFADSWMGKLKGLLGLAGLR